MLEKYIIIITKKSKYWETFFKEFKIIRKYIIMNFVGQHLVIFVDLTNMPNVHLLILDRN